MKTDLEEVRAAALDDTLISDIDFCVIDTETTGGSPVFNRIIDVAVLHFKNGEIIRRFSSLVNPGMAIPPWITQLTGIDDAMVREAPAFEDIAGPLADILEKGVFAAHNARFDYGFVQEEFRRHGKAFQRPQCCTLKLARHLVPDLPSRSLGMLCDHFLIDLWARHRAFGDAEATVYVLKELLRRASSDFGVKTWRDLDALSNLGRLELPPALSFHEIARLPAAPGSFVFRDRRGEKILAGQSKNVRNRVRTYFHASNQSEKSKMLRANVHAVEILSEN